MLRKTLLTLALVGFAPVVLAAAPGSKAVDMKTQLAIRLLQASHFDRTIQAMQGQMASMLERQFGAETTCPAAQPVIREYSTALSSRMATVLGSEDMKVDVAAVYAEVFSEDELRQIIAFYQSPIGKKLLDRMPELMQKSVGITQDRLRAMMPDLQKLGAQYAPKIDDAAATCRTAVPAGAKSGE